MPGKRKNKETDVIAQNLCHRMLRALDSIVSAAATHGETSKEMSKALAQAESLVVEARKTLG